MMTNRTTKEIEASIAGCDKMIKIQEAKRRKYEQELMDNATDFPATFKAWYENSDECHHDWWISGSDFPLLHKISEDGANNQQFRRSQTVELCDMIEEEMNVVLDGGKNPSEEDLAEFEKYYKYDYEKKLKFETYEDFYNNCEALCKEAMDGKMKSFCLDW